MPLDGSKERLKSTVVSTDHWDQQTLMPTVIVQTVLSAPNLVDRRLQEATTLESNCHSCLDHKAAMSRKPVPFQQAWIVKFGLEISTRDIVSSKVTSVLCFICNNVAVATMILMLTARNGSEKEQPS
jgi:hypothetical protein